MDNTVSLIIPAKDTGQLLQACLGHIAACSPPPLEVIVVLDGYSGQPVPEPGLPALRILSLPERVGPGQARNIGARIATGDVLLFVDADVLVQGDIVTRLTKVFASAPRPDAAFGSYDDQPFARNTVSQYKNLLHHYVHQNADSDAFTFWTGCGAVLRTRFLELGGFNADYRHPSIEDIAFGYRLKEVGATILLDKTIQVTHLKQWSLQSLLRTDFLLRAIPWSRLILCSGSMRNDMNINIANRVSVLLSWIIVLLMPLVPFHSFGAAGVLLAFALLLFVNRGLFRFFQRKRGWWFMLRTIPLHFLYFLSSGLAFAVVFLPHLWDRLFRPANSKGIAAG